MGLSPFLLFPFLAIFIVKNVGLMNQAPTKESIPR